MPTLPPSSDARSMTAQSADAQDPMVITLRPRPRAGHKAVPLVAATASVASSR